MSAGLPGLRWGLSKRPQQLLNILQNTQTFKPSRAPIGRPPVTWGGAVSRCAVPRASAEWSLSANSFSSGSIWNPLHSLTITGGPLFFSPFPRIILHHGRQKEPDQVRRLARCRFVAAALVPGLDVSDASFPPARGSFLPFSLGLPQLARIVQSLWRLARSPRTQSLKQTKGFFSEETPGIRRNALPSRRSPAESRCRNWHCSLSLLLADMLSVLDARNF